MRYLGIDFGLKRIGLAISDKQGKMVFPYKTIIKKDNEQLFSELQKIFIKEKIQAIVVGLPQGLNGEFTLSTRQVLNFIHRLNKISSLPVYTINESLSTEEANEKLKKAKVPPKKRKSILDQQAAVIILENFLGL